MHPHSLEEDLSLAADNYWTKAQLWVSDSPQGTDINPAFHLGYADQLQDQGFAGLKGVRITADLENPCIDAEIRVALGDDVKSVSPYMTGGMLVGGRPLFDPGRYLALYTKSFAPGTRITYPLDVRPIPRFQGVGGTFKSIGAVSPTWPPHQVGDIGLMAVETDNQNIGTLPAGWAHVTGSPIGTDGAGAPPAFQGISSFGATTGSLTKHWPTHITGDIALLVVESANEVVTLSTPAGFVEIPDSPQGTGTAGGTTATRLTVFWCRATSSSMTAPVVADAGDHIAVYMLSFRGCVETGDPWDVTAGDVAASASTSVSIPGDTTTGPNRLIVALVANGTDTTTPQVSGWTNASLTGLLEQVNENTASGNGGGFSIATGVKAGAGTYSATTATLATSSVQARISLALKPAAGGGANKTMLSLLWKRAASNAEPALSIGDSGDHQIAQIVTVRGCIATGNPWDVASAQVQESETAAVSISGVTTTVANTLVLQVATNSTSSLNAQGSDWESPGLANFTRRWDTQTNVGNGGGFSVLTGEKATAGGMANTTGVLLTPSVQAYMTIALKPPSPTGGEVELLETDLPWRPVFVSRIDSADPASEDNTLVLQCRDITSDVLDRWIEPPVRLIPANDANRVIQELLALGFPELSGNDLAHQFLSLDEHTILIPAYNQQPMSALLAMREVALLDGSDLRGRWSPFRADHFALAYYIPDRAITGLTYTIGPGKYFTLGGLTKSRDEVRNRVSVTPSDPPRTPVVLEDATSIAKYGLRFLGVVEDEQSRIRTPEQATALATAIRSDTKEPKVMVVLNGPFLPFVEINDVLVLEANDKHHDTDLVVAVSGYIHTFDPDGTVRTTLNTRDLPAAANAEWRKGEPKMDYVATADPTGTAPEGAVWTVVTS